MIRNQKPTNIIHHPAEFFDFVNTAQVLVYTKRPNVSPFCGHFNAKKQCHASLFGVVFDLGITPGIVVLSNADAFEADFFGPG